ncbi:hypothetical protein AAULR_22879, partial [Lacticaseibacillus rhamnosus MTCC 5462]
KTCEPLTLLTLSKFKNFFNILLSGALAKKFVRLLVKYRLTNNLTNG